jgi:hypothetical protein
MCETVGYCSLYINSDLDVSTIARAISAADPPPAIQSSSLVGDLELSFYENPDADSNLAACRDYLYFPVVIEALPSIGTDRTIYKAAIARLLERIWGYGLEAVAGCDFQSELPRAGGAYITPDRIQDNPLTHAAWGNNVELVRRMLRYGTNPDYPDSSGKTALTRASGSGNIQIMKMLLDCGADIDGSKTAVFEGVFTPLMAAAWKSTEAISLLLSLNMDPNVCDRWGRTALMFAALYGPTDVIIKLLENGADAGLVESRGMTAAELARRIRQDEHIARVIEEWGRNQG